MAGKKITELSSGSLSNISLSGVTAVVYSGTTFQHPLSDLRNQLVDSGSHYFTGSQFINGDLTISGSITAQQYILSSSITNITTETISGSSNFGNSDDDTHTFTGSINITGSLFMNGDEVSILGSGSHIAFFDGNKSLRWYDSFHTIEGGNTLAIGVDQTSLGGSNSEYREKLIVASNDSHNIATFQGGVGNHYAALNIINFNSGSNASADLVIMNDIQNESSSYVNLGINSTTHTNLTCGYEGDSYLFNTSDDFYIGNLEIGNSLETNGHTHLFSAGAWRHPSISMYGNTSVGFFTEKPDNKLYVIPSYLDGFKVEFSGSVKMDNDLKVDGWVSGSHFVGDGSGLYNLNIPSVDTSMLLSSSVFETFTSSYTSDSASFDSRITEATNEQDLSYFATTGSNTFVGNQIISGSIYMGTGSIILSNGTEISDRGEYGVSSGISLGNNGFNIEFGSNANDWAIFQNARLIKMLPSEEFAISIEGNETGWGFNGNGMYFPDDTLQTTAYPGPIETGSFATTGSNTFNGNQTISGSILLEGDAIDNGINIGTAGTYVGTAEGFLYLKDASGYIQLDAQNPTNYAQIILAADNEDFFYVNHYTTGNNLKFTTSGSLLLNEVSYDAHLATTGSNTFNGNQTISGSLDISGSATLNDGNIVSSNTIEKIETITSASYASITPVSGTLYIIIN